MIVFSCEGMRSIDERDVIACSSEQPTRRWCNVTVTLADGREISGRAATQAVRTLEAMLNELPPAA